MMSKRSVYIIKDANGDEDQTFVIEGDLDANDIIKLTKCLMAIGYYLEAATSRGDKSQLVQRIATLEKMVKDQA